MSEIKTGGPAFPEIFTDEKSVGEHGKIYIADTYYSGGMTLRDHFAGKALQGMMVNADWQYSEADRQRKTPQYYAKLRADFCVMQADALIKSLKGGEAKT